MRRQSNDLHRRAGHGTGAPTKEALGWPLHGCRHHGEGDTQGRRALEAEVTEHLQKQGGQLRAPEPLELAVMEPGGSTHSPDLVSAQNQVGALKGLRSKASPQEPPPNWYRQGSDSIVRVQ